MFIVFSTGLISQTIIPKFEVDYYGGINIINNGIIELNLVPFKVLFDTYKDVFINGNISFFLINFFGNIIMFMPTGFFIPLLYKISYKKVIFIDFCTSLFIELCQSFLPRATDVDDLLLNTIGVYLGLLLYKFLFSRFKNIMMKYQS